MFPPPLSRESLREYWRELVASAITLAAIAVLMILAVGMEDLRGLGTGIAFALGGAAYAATAAIPFRPRLRAALIVLAPACVLDGVLLAREPFVFGIALVLALAVALAVGGAYGIIDALRKRHRRCGWTIGSALIALGASAILVTSLPGTATWVPGVACALAMVVHAERLLRLARAGHRLERRVLASAALAV
jgi:uncharacterized membrane protein HdeD (DUF308 family)